VAIYTWPLWMTIFERSSKLWRTISFLTVALRAMALTKKNSSFDALNVVLNVLMTPLSYRRISSTCLAGTVVVLVVPTSRVPRCSARRNASPTPPLELTMKPTALTPSIFFALVSFKALQDLMFHLCLPSSMNPSRQCSRFHYPLLVVWIFVLSLLYKNPKWMKSSGILLAFLTNPPKHVGPSLLENHDQINKKSTDLC
jgi:hypothetical protein